MSGIYDFQYFSGILGVVSKEKAEKSSPHSIGNVFTTSSDIKTFVFQFSYSPFYT